ncbi:GNAT family N-acetyltransferase [Hyphomicrobium methylovorum]|uniref:GNAT family N-acetyltransferase n=1 Tax=Hyphomicrobium methylovorum TaxID=84 RepID=UPI0015E73D8A|nr:GNAT family N-acetyltransferase [Hyphomicrobium methylovorum]MBA2126871.1 GNAT family N-acetyltransferase [Hyphomicrobium methylovorum]
MATTTDVGDGRVLGLPERLTSALSSWRGKRFITEVFDGADEALAALEAVELGLVSTGFQTLDWLTVLYEELAPAARAMPRVVVVSECDSGDVAMILPLLIKKKRSLTVAQFADLGVCQYGAPILGPAFPASGRAIARVWRGVCDALADVDLIRLHRMPATIGGRANPLLMLSRVTPSRRFGNRVTVPDTVEMFLQSRGKKYRKEVERCYRLLEKEGEARFYRATTPDEIARVCSVLDEQQQTRHLSLGGRYVLSEPIDAFYERLAIDGSEAGLAALFALEVRGEIIASLFGIQHGGTFSLLRIATDPDAASHYSPGRLLILEAMKYFVAQDVRRFDLGLGNHPFIRSFGGEDVPLYDLIVARDISAAPKALFHRMQGRMRRSRLVGRGFHSLKGLFARGQ